MAPCSRLCGHNSPGAKNGRKAWAVAWMWWTFLSFSPTWLLSPFSGSFQVATALESRIAAKAVCAAYAAAISDDGRADGGSTAFSSDTEDALDTSSEGAGSTQQAMDCLAHGDPFAGKAEEAVLAVQDSDSSSSESYSSYNGELITPGCDKDSRMAPKAESVQITLWGRKGATRKPWKKQVQQTPRFSASLGIGDLALDKHRVFVIHNLPD